eukprot:TRINITY_DN10_c0_g1_i2.p1 TRINITY_DN10_c0_g1~~TRINITY_DN10_c0_g1_i2.p1  ORF type:complete len:138 (-),score=31.84 TRINITY_DN10_c0_g1_i2:18-431(-)
MLLRRLGAFSMSGGIQERLRRKGGVLGAGAAGAAATVQFTLTWWSERRGLREQRNLQAGLLVRLLLRLHVKKTFAFAGIQAVPLLRAFASDAVSKSLTLRGCTKPDLSAAMVLQTSFAFCFVHLNADAQACEGADIH